MDPVLVVAACGVVIVVGLLVESLRALVAAGAGLLAGIGLIRAVFAAIEGDVLAGAVWAVAAAVGAVLFAAEIRRARRSTEA